MTAPIALRPDPDARTSRRSFMRAAATTFIGHRDREDPAKVLHSGPQAQAVGPAQSTTSQPPGSRPNAK